MTDDRKQLINRFEELASRSFDRGIWVFSEFLTLAEQDVLMSAEWKLAVPVQLLGGYESAERRIAAFGSEELCGYTESPPIACVEIAPSMAKFADALTHRDFLGALMSLGIRRELLGDILIDGKTAYLFCLESCAGFIASELHQVRHTTVVCRICDTIPDVAAAQPEETEHVAASERLDAVISSIYSLSRSEAKELFLQSKVYVNSVLTSDASKNLREGDVVSVRGRGRFKYTGISRETKKGRLRVRALVYK